MAIAEFSLPNRREAIPVSQLPYPKEVWNRCKYWFWKMAYPIHPLLRNFLLRCGMVRHVGRQNFLLGRIVPGKTLKDFLAYLHRRGFGNHFIAWVDEGEIISLRLLDGFERQYHFRIFKDGEVRGHYEFTPEHRPIWHLKDKGMEPRREDFLKLLGDWITPV